jgi:hypothetical protein
LERGKGERVVEKGMDHGAHTVCVFAGETDDTEVVPIQKERGRAGGGLPGKKRWAEKREGEVGRRGRKGGGGGMGQREREPREG